RVRSLAEQLSAVRQLAVRELQREPFGHVVRADRKTTRRRGGASELVALIEQLQRTRAAHSTGTRVRIRTIRRREAAIAIAGGRSHSGGHEHVLAHVVLPGLARD